MDRERNIEDILGLTDSESSSSDPGVFEANYTYIYDIHNVKKDEPPPVNPIPDTKHKKLKKKKKDQSTLNKSRTSTSSDSLSAIQSLAHAVEPTKEEFFDAHESYHTIRENKPPILPAALTILEVQSNQPSDSKIQEQPTNMQLGFATACHISSTISKPVTRQE